MRTDNIYTSDKIREIVKDLADKGQGEVKYQLTIFPYKDYDEYHTLTIETTNVCGVKLIAFCGNTDKGVFVMTSPIELNDMGGAMQNSIKEAIKGAFGLRDRTYSVAITNKKSELDNPEDYLAMANNALMDAGQGYDERMSADLAGDFMEMQDELGISKDQMKRLKSIITQFATQTIHAYKRWVDVPSSCLISNDEEV